MKKYPLTESGVENKLNELYALSDPLLAVQAAAITADFETWMNDNFTLVTEQQSYIAGMNPIVKTQYGASCGLFFLFRLPIEFDYPAPPTTSYGKWIDEQKGTTVKANSLGAIEITGTLKYKVYYVLN